MPEYKLTYFNIKGLGEGIRFLLSYLGKDFEDVRVEFSEWPSKKRSMPFGRMPVLEFDGKGYTQSTAICRYLATGTDLAGKTPLENLEIDQITGVIIDFAMEVKRVWMLQGQAKEDFQKTARNEIVPFYMDKIENLIQKNGGYVAAERLTWADLYLVGYFETLCPMLDIKDHAERYPRTTALVQTVHSQPGIKEWIQRRPAGKF